MAKIYIDTKKIRPCVTRTGDLARELKRLAQEVEQIRGNLNYKIAGKAAIDAQLRNVSAQTLQEETAVRSMGDALEQIAAWYERTENANLGRVAPEKNDASNGGGGQGVFAPSNWMEDLKNRYGSWIFDLISSSPYPIIGLMNILVSGKRSEELTSSESHGFGRQTQEIKVGGEAEWEAVERPDTDWKYNSKYYRDPKTGEITMVDETDDKALQEFKEHNDLKENRGIPIDVKFLSVGTEASASIYGGEAKISGKYGGLETNYDVLKTEGHINGYIGTLGVGGELGASITAFTMEDIAYLGNENTQAFAKAKVTAGKVEGKIGGQAGLYDKDGKFNPSAYVGASAEAIAGEISGSAGVKALGTEVAVTGSLNYGVGAHANVGMHDGKISVDVGATLGVGASVKLEIDVSGTIDAIHDKAGEVWSGVKNLFRW